MMKKLTICLLTLALLLCAAPAAWADLEPRVEAPPLNILPAPVPSLEASDSSDAADTDALDIAPTEAMSEELARLTQKVKTTLEIDDSFTDFYGNQTESGYATTWHLNWGSAEENISVEVASSGQIISYNRNNYERYYYGSDFAPIFPKNGREQAQALAENFLRRVLAANESFDFEASLEEPLLEAREQYSFYFGGSLLINGLKSPLYASVSVDAKNMRVSSFWREPLAREYIGGIPSPTPKITATEAVKTLTLQYKLEPAYYLPDHGTEARLQYRPAPSGTYYVDAQSGALIDMDKLFEEAAKQTQDRGLAGGKGASADMAVAENEAAAAPAASLSPVEKGGISQLEGLLSREELDAKLRGISELGLDASYILSSANFERGYQEPAAYIARLNYYREADARSLGLSEQGLQSLKQDDRQLYIYKYVTLDAATGELQNIYTSRPYIEPALVSVKEQGFEQAATAFLDKYYGDKLALAGRDKTDKDSAANYLYTQRVNGYSYGGNYLSLGLNPYSGVVEQFSFNWRDDISFAPATGIISADKARAIYLDTMTCQLYYRGLPQAIDPALPGMEPYFNSGQKFLYQMALVYGYEPDPQNTAYAIDALSGETLAYQNSYRRQLSYDDIAGHAAEKQITELARYGVGFEGGKFAPTAKLTELDMLTFLLSAGGYIYPTAQELDEEKINSIYREAVALGVIERGQKQPTRQISRGELVKTIVAMSGYGKTALIPGIYACDFADAEQIPAELYGYVAIAQGLGLVKSGPALSFKAGETIDRAEAALIFYNFMDRKY